MWFASPRWLLAIAFALIVPGLFWGLPSAVTAQVDAPVPLGPLYFFAQYHNPQIDTIYPAFHQLLLLPLYAAAIGVYWVMGGISHLSSAWPYGMHNVSALFSALILLSNLVSAMMGLCMLYVAWRLAARSRSWGWTGVLVAATNGVFVYYCRVGNLDIPYNFWWAVALFFLWKYFFQGATFAVSLLPAAIASGCALGSKDQAAGLVLGGGLAIMLFSTPQVSSFAKRFCNSALFSFCFLTSYAAVAILPHPLRWWYHLLYILADVAPTPIPRSPSGEWQTLLLTLGWLLKVFTIPVLALAAAGAVFLFRKRRGREFWVLVIPLLTYYVVAVAPTRVFYPRFTIPFFIPVLVLVIHGSGFLAERFFASPMARVAWATALITYLAVQTGMSYVPVTYAQVFDMKRRLAQELPSVLSPGSPLLISRMQSYNFPNLGVYESYRLMMLPQDPVAPPSRHAANLLHPLESSVPYFLWGSGNTGLPWNPMGDYPRLTGDLVREWRYPGWVKDHVLVPCIYEFALYRRTGPLP
ncbi:MAG: hypothetical protein ABSH50_08980 [Bryobacteraceae bacterium]|jgi:hypothetical protein